MQAELVLVRDFEGRLFEMKAVGVARGLVYVVRSGDDDGLDAVGVPEEDVFKFTNAARRGKRMERWRGPSNV